MLSSAITRGQFETAIFLIERGADLHLLNRTATVPLTRYPTKTPIDPAHDKLTVNYGAAQIQRITGADGSRGDEVSRALRRLLIEHGVQIPFWDPDSIRHLDPMPLKELRRRGVPEDVILKIIRINKAAEIEEFGANLDSYRARGFGYGHNLEQEYLAEQGR